MKKIGILGGTFNPIHNGHIALGMAAYKEFELDKVIFIPSGISYLKKDDSIPSGEVRLSMVNLAINKYTYFESSDIEIKRLGNTYTYDTMIELNQLYPDSELYFICGADTLYSLKNWYKAEELMKMTNFIISVRNGKQIKELIEIADEYNDKYESAIYFLKSTNIEISSTYIRDNIKNEDYIKEYLDKDVLKYIKDNELYI